jgi:hypothetical protein
VHVMSWGRCPMGREAAVPRCSGLRPIVHPECHLEAFRASSVRRLTITRQLTMAREKRSTTTVA